jgi:hypothetical protein
MLRMLIPAVIKACVLMAASLILSVSYAQSPMNNERDHSDTNMSIGKSLYEGTHATYQATQPSGVKRVRDARDASMALPTEQSACIACHRPSGLGSFEGGVAVPPIAGHLLFNAYDTATAKRYKFAYNLRIRPAYSEADLRTLLATGRTPDGRQLSPLMPRYDFNDSEVAALSSHLKSLSAERAPGVSEDMVTFATITTDEVPQSDVDDLMNTLNMFFTTKNAGTRGEFGRRAQAQRKEQIMYLRHRNWQLRHWQLSGAPSTWAAQLDALWAREPVFAVLSGLSGQTWQPVQDFCARTATPCLLPMVDLPPQAENFYSVYFTRGVVAQAAQALQYAKAEIKLAAGSPVWVSTSDDAAGQQQKLAIQAQVSKAGFTTAASAEQASLVLRTWVQQSANTPSPVVSQKHEILLGGTTQNWQILSANSNIYSRVYVDKPLNLDIKNDNLSGQGTPLMASDFRLGPDAKQATLRSNVWLKSRGLNPHNPTIAQGALFAATLATESLMHVDDKFSREYCVEKLEHNMENIPPMTAYERLSIGPKQRFASKQVHISSSWPPPGHTQEAPVTLKKP